MRPLTIIARRIKQALLEPGNEYRTVSIFITAKTKQLYLEFNMFQGIHIDTINDKDKILLCSYQSNKPLASLCIYNKNKCVLTESTIARDILAQIKESKDMLLKTQNYRFPDSLLEELFYFINK